MRVGATWMRRFVRPHSAMALLPRRASFARALSHSHAPADEPQSFSHAHFDTKSRPAGGGPAGGGPPPPPEQGAGEDAEGGAGGSPTEHAVISMFDLFSIGMGPSSSHTVGPMRAGAIFVSDLREKGILPSVTRIKLALYGSLAATGKGHMTPQALLLGLEGADCETIDTDSVPDRYKSILDSKQLTLGRDTPDKGEPQRVAFDFDRDLQWMWGQTLPVHSNGMRMSVFDKNGDLLATNDYYSIGGGFIVNGNMAIAKTPGPRPPRELAPEEPGGPVERAGASAVAEQPEAAASMQPPPEDLPPEHPVDALENVFYKSIRPQDAGSGRREGSSPSQVPSGQPLRGDGSQGGEPAPGGEEKPREPPFPFHNMASLLALTRQHNLTIAQIVYENELTWASPDEIHEKIMRIWSVMDEGIRAGVHSDKEFLPGPLRMKRRAPHLYARLMRGVYMGPRRLGNMAGRPGVGDGRAPGMEHTERDGPGRSTLEKQRAQPSVSIAPYRRRGRESRDRSPAVRGSFFHEVMPVPARRPNFPAMDWLSCWAIATNEQVAAGGRIIIAPTLGAAGIIPAVLRYVVEFVAISPEDEENLVMTFLLTAAAIGMLFKRGATISAAEGGCMAEVGTSCSMAAGAFAACMGGSPEVIEQAAETAIEHNLGLTCDPVEGLVQAPCIERNAVGAVKAVVSANLALSTDGMHSISLDEAIHAARLTAADMHTKYKETRYVHASCTPADPQPEWPGHHRQGSRSRAGLLDQQCLSRGGVYRIHCVTRDADRASALGYDGIFVWLGRRVQLAVWRKAGGPACAVGRSVRPAAAAGPAGPVGRLVWAVFWAAAEPAGWPVWPAFRTAEPAGRTAAGAVGRSVWPAATAGAVGRSVWSAPAGPAGPAGPARPAGRLVWAIDAAWAVGRPVWTAGPGPAWAVGWPVWAE